MPTRQLAIEPTDRRYHLDWLTAAMLFGASLDCATTWWVLFHHVGVEANPVAAALFHHSLWWVPVYLLCRPLLVPLLPQVPRNAFATFYFLLGLSCGVNNVGGILYHHYFFVQRFGIRAITGFWVFMACGLFAVSLRKCRASKERFRELMLGVSWVGVFLALEGIFWAVGLLWP